MHESRLCFIITLKTQLMFQACSNSKNYYPSMACLSCDKCTKHLYLYIPPLLLPWCDVREHITIGNACLDLKIYLCLFDPSYVPACENISILATVSVGQNTSFVNFLHSSLDSLLFMQCRFLISLYKALETRKKILKNKKKSYIKQTYIFLSWYSNGVAK